MFSPFFRSFCVTALATSLAVNSIAATPNEPEQPVPLREAAQRMTVPDGFRVTLFAGEPDIVQPIAMTTDERGRLWVVECLSYPKWQTNRVAGQDRVVILEDKDGDGHFDARRVFWDKGRNLSGIALGFGGVWLCSAPELIFIPDRNRDDTPDGPPEVVLDGWTLDGKHNIVNALTWGPDGWLYGCHGILADSKVGRPGSPQADRVTLNCGVWRFHPTQHVVEAVAHGTTNPWGIAFDQYGQMFIANCVIKHLFHVIPGARYERMYGQDANPYAFELLQSCADHIHWAGGYWDTEGVDLPQNDAFGGGHAHCGAMVYLGDNWPDRYRNGFFTLNVHGHRMNHDALERRGSGYVAKHQPDVLRVNDAWFRGVSLLYGPDGGVFMSDWCDDGECHDYDVIHQENGRIYKITYGTPKATAPDLARLSDADLAKLQLHKNEWHAGQARLLLQARAASGKLATNTRSALLQILREETDAVRQLRALWALHVIQELDDALVDRLLANPQEHIRAWTVQLALEKRNASSRLLARLAALAEHEPSPVARLALASSLQRLPLRERLPIAQALGAHGEDAEDSNLPLMIWYGIEPLVSIDADVALTLLAKARIPLLRQFIAQRLALRLALDALTGAIQRSSDAGFQQDVVRGMFQALNGRRAVAMPRAWRPAAAQLYRHPDPDVQETALRLALVFGDIDAATQLQRRASDTQQTAMTRQKALQALVQAKIPGLVSLLQPLVADPSMRTVAIRGLAAFDDPATPEVILRQYSAFSFEEKADAISTLASRAGYAVALLEAAKRGAVPVRDISPFTARQLQALKDPRIRPLLETVLGEVRSVSRDKAAQIARYKQMLTSAALKTANRSDGRALFDRTCAACHTLFDSGGKLAPELTGSQRSNLDYILENVVDPNAIVSSLYRATYFETADDRLISGIVLRENESTVSIQTQTGTLTLPRNEITSRHESALSMMPEGLLDSLSPQEVIDLVAYLQSPSQVPLPGRK
ncbi:MAG: c-type cytochrome [Verrucomicrobia bacterium]|nr:c-type cytochrome [Verrucomicrobiota bacterium]